MEIQLTVNTPKGKITFRCIPHLSKCKEDLLIEPEFYVRYSKAGVPFGDHYELELLETPWLPEGAHSIHIHHNPHTNRNFVCWPSQLPTIKEAEQMFRVWCVGTAYTLIHGMDFVTLFEGDFMKFLNYMEKMCGIIIEE